MSHSKCDSCRPTETALALRNWKPRIMSDKDEKHAVSLLKRLIKAQAGGETAVQKVIVQYLDAIGCLVEELKYAPESVSLVGEFAHERESSEEPRTVVVGRLPGADELPSIMLFAHPDSEPPSNLENWTHPPFAGEIRDGRIYGWGVADDLAGCAAALLALSDIVSSKAPVGDIAFVSAPSKRHARGTAAFLNRGHRMDAALYLHPAESGFGMREIKAVTSGQLEFEILVRGKRPDTTEPSHTSFSHLGHNPVDKAVLIYNSLKSLSESRASRVAHRKIEALVGRATNLHISRIACDEETALSRISERCVIGGAISFPPGEQMESVCREVEQAIQRVNEGDAWLSENPAQITWISGTAGAEVPEDHPLFCIASEAIRKVTGVSPSVNPMHTASDIRNPMVQAGMPCIGFGCLGGNLSQNGATDEWVEVEDFERMARAASLITKTWAEGAH